MEESFIVISSVGSEKKRGGEKRPPPMPKYRKNTPCEIGLTQVIHFNTQKWMCLSFDWLSVYIKGFASGQNVVHRLPVDKRVSFSVS